MGAVLAPLSWLELAVLSCVAVVIVAVHLYLAWIWNGLEVFSQYNVLFNADPNAWTGRLAHGYRIECYFHPLAGYFFAVPIRALGMVAQLGASTLDVLRFREAIALGISPLTAGIKCFCLYIVFRKLNLRKTESALACALSVFAFSSVVYSATPEGYAMSAASMAFILLCAVVGMKRSWLHLLLLLGFSGFISLGITISNAIFHGWSAWAAFAARGESPLRALVRAVAFSACTAVAVIMASAALSNIREPGYGWPPLPARVVTKYTLSLSTQCRNVLHYPAILARSFVPTVPQRVPNTLAAVNRSPIKFELAYTAENSSRWAMWPLGIAAVLVFGGGTWCACRQGGMWRWLGLANTASLLTFGTLYSLWGNNPFLYVQYFNVPAVFLAAAWFTWEPLRTKTVYAVAAVLLLLLMIGDIAVLSMITDWVAARADVSMM